MLERESRKLYNKKMKGHIFPISKGNWIKACEDKCINNSAMSNKSIANILELLFETYLLSQIFNYKLRTSSSLVTTWTFKKTKRVCLSHRRGKNVQNLLPISNRGISSLIFFQKYLKYWPCSRARTDQKVCVNYLRFSKHEHTNLQSAFNTHTTNFLSWFLIHLYMHTFSKLTLSLSWLVGVRHSGLP